MHMTFNLEGTPLDLAITSVVVAGWTGRNMQAVQHHIDELKAIGIAPPSQVPLYYRVSQGLLTQAPRIDVLGAATSGEVEPLLIRAQGRTYLGLASDHTDRDLERHSVAASKQACAKPVSDTLWAMDTLEDHIEDLILRAYIDENGKEVLYQEGTLAAIRPLGELCEGADMGDGTAMLCGTFAAIGGVRPATRYRMELADPTNGKTLGLSYTVQTLPIVS